MVPRDVAAFGRAVATVLRGALVDDFIGAYFVGSIALGGYVRGESDIDIIAITRSSVPNDRRQPIADAVVAVTTGCPTRGLEFTLYRTDVVARPPVDADFELNANGGPRMERAVHLDPADESGFWYVLDRAVAHRHGIGITGPPASELFADVERSTLLDAMTQSMRWHRAHERATLYSVLNACRAWRFAIDDVLGSKLDGAAWARTRWSNPEVIDAAVDLRHGHPAELQIDDVDELLSHAEHILLTTS